VPPALAQRWREEPWAEEPCDADALLDEIGDAVLAHPMGNGHPRWHGWVNGPPDRAGVLASLLAAAADPSCAGGNHAALHLERQVVRWLAELVELPPGAGGLLVSGASMAAYTALAAARQAHAGFDVRTEGLAGGPQLRVYATAEAHVSVAKAVELLGIGRRGLRTVAVDGTSRMDPGDLDTAVRDDLAQGMRPIAVVASAGTTNTGAVDPLDAIADVCAAHGIWLHVDGAYGAPAILAPRCRDALAPMARAESVAVDPLFVPVDAGILLVRDPQALQRAFSLVPDYLRLEHDPDGLSDAPWASESSPEQTRPFRALRVWAALRSTGRDGYRRLVQHDLDLAALLAERVRAHPRLDLVAHGLSVVCFRCDGDDRQDAIATRIQLSGRAFLTSTRVDGRPALRACFVNPLTTAEDVDTLVQDVLAAADAC
jgi:glutamate/tyrosine decarboxylase-like PLP-dependent enzyme